MIPDAITIVHWADYCRGHPYPELDYGPHPHALLLTHCDGEARCYGLP